MRGRKDAERASPRPVRCAIYTRKSTDEGLDSEFNSLDAQREAAESYIPSQHQEGWEALPGRYDDGGFSGGNLWSGPGCSVYWRASRPAASTAWWCTRSTGSPVPFSTSPG